MRVRRTGSSALRGTRRSLGPEPERLPEAPAVRLELLHECDLGDPEAGGEQPVEPLLDAAAVARRVVTLPRQRRVRRWICAGLAVRRELRVPAPERAHHVP